MTDAKKLSLENASTRKKRGPKRRLNFTSEDWYDQAFKTFSVSAKRQPPEQIQSPPLAPKKS